MKDILDEEPAREKNWMNYIRVESGEGGEIKSDSWFLPSEIEHMKFLYDLWATMILL